MAKNISYTGADMKTYHAVFTDGEYEELCSLLRRGHLEKASNMIRVTIGVPYEEIPRIINEVKRELHLTPDAEKLTPDAEKSHAFTYIDYDNEKKVVSLTEGQFSKIKSLLRQREKIQAIKLFRDYTQSNLKGAKNIVDELDLTVTDKVAPATAPAPSYVYRIDPDTIPPVVFRRPCFKNIEVKGATARGRNGYFKAQTIELSSSEKQELSIRVWSSRQGRSAPIIVNLSANDAHALRLALDNMLS